MPDLPDLPTGDISFVAYWNAIDDGGVASIDPEDVLTNDHIEEYTLYDNGVQIEKWYRPSSFDSESNFDAWNGRDKNEAGGEGPKFKARVKSDGWVVAWIDRTEEYVEREQNLVNGPWDLVWNWRNSSEDVATLQQPDSSGHSLARLIEELAQEFSNWGLMNFGYSDVSLYNYQAESATHVTILHAKRDAGTGPDESTDYGVGFTAGTEIHWSAFAAATWGGGAYFITETDGQEILSDHGTNNWSSAYEDPHLEMDTAGQSYPLFAVGSDHGLVGIFLWS